MLFEVGLQALAVLRELTTGLVKLQAFEALNALITILPQVVSQRIFADSNTIGYLMMRQSLGFQEQGFHLSLHTWVGVMVALVIQFFDLFFAERQLQHPCFSLR